MPPKTLTAEQVAEIDRQQQKPVNWSAVIPQKEDVLTARVNREAARQDAPPMLTAEQTDAAEAQNSVAAETSFGRAMGARPDRSVGPQVPAPKKVLSAAEVDEADYERVGNISYIPTKDEWKRYGELRQRRDDKVGKFIEAGQAIAGGLVQAAAATAYAPFDFVTRGTKAYDEWVNSSAEGMRQASISTAELWSWAGDVVNDSVRETERVNIIDNQLRQRLAAENKFTGNTQADAQIFAQAREQAMASGAYEKTQEQEADDEDTQYQRFIRDRSFQQQAANVTETNIGTLPDGRAEMGIDESKLNQGLVLASALVLDPLNIAIPAGLGAANKVRLLRRVGSLAGKPLKLGSKVAGGAAQKAENLYSGIVEGVEGATGVGEAGQAAALSAVSWKAAAAMATLKGSGKLLRRAERGLETGSIIAREIGIGGVGVSRVEAASKLRSAPIPERYRRAYDGFFTSADSTLRRVSETQGLSPIARRSAATLDKLGATQAFRLADDAVSGAAATAPIAVPLAAIAPEERQPEILGAIMTVGAGAGVIGGKMRRMSEFDDALVAKMLADAEISGGDATSMANMMPHDRLVNMARMQSVISPKADFIPLRATDYEINTTVKEAMGLGTRGIYVDAKKGQRPRIFVNLDKMATGDVAGHEIGHAILKSDILGGEVKRGMRAMVDQQYGTDGVAARGREYVAANLTQEVRDGTTGIQLNVLRPDEVTRIAAAGGDEAAEQALKNEFIRERWANDTDWRKQAIEERADMLNQERLAQGEISWDWARDEIAAETFSGLGNGLNLSGIRASGPLSRAVGAASAGFEAMGARMRGNGRLETPNRLFVENPLFNTPEMRKAVNNYVKTFDRYLVGLEKEGAVKQRGTPIAPTGKASDAIRSPHTRLHKNGNVVENDLFFQRPDGTVVPKSQQQINTQDKSRAATIKSINDRNKFVNENSNEWGARKLSNGRVEVGGPNLPPQFDYFIQIPEYHRNLVREFEAGRAEGRSYLYSINVIGSRDSGTYKVTNYGNIEAKTGEMVPFGAAVSTKNHVLIKAIDLNSFRASAIRAIDNEQLGEFGNDLRAVETGLKQLLSNYENGVAGETGLGVTRKNILNGLLGTGTVMQRQSNPAWHTLNNQGSVRTFRLDRINYAEPYGTGYFPHYNKININALPDDAGRMSLDQYGQFDADRKAAWMNKEAVKRGFSNATNWQNADAQGFQAADGQYRQQFPAGGAAQRGSAMPDKANVSFLPDTVVSDEGGTVWRALQEAPVITLKDLRGRKVFASFADLTSAGKLYRGIDSSEVAIPVRTHGGPEWPLLQAERVGEETNVWSNQGAGVSTTKAKRADEGAIMLVAAMHKNAHVSNTETSTAVIATNAAYARDGRIAGDNLQRLDDMIRAEMPDFVGIESPDVMAYVNKLPFQGERSRSRIAQILGSKEAEALGAPNLQRILDEMRSSEFDGLRIGDAVMAIELTAGAPVLKLGENGTLKHPSYQYAVRGRVLGRFARPINVETIFDDFYAQRRAQGKPQQGDRRALDLAKPVQVITDAIADRIPSTAYTAIKSPRHAQLINMAVNDQWRSTSASVKQGGVSPADIVSALNASPAKVALSRYDLKTLSGKVRAKELEVFQLGDSGVYFGVRKGDPASDYGLAPDAYGFGPDERTLTLVMNNERKAGGMADAIVVKALQNGVTALDCFAVKSGRSPSGFLPELYERFGFQRVGEIPFDPSFYSKTELADLRKYWKSTGWDESAGMPSIVLMKWKGTNEQRPKSLRELVGQSSSGVRQGDKRGSLFRDAEGSSGRLPRRRGGSQRRTGQGDAGAGQGVQGSDAGVRLGRGILGPVEELIGLSPAELRNLGIQ
jgi:hypothetical protein